MVRKRLKSAIASTAVPTTKKRILTFDLLRGIFMLNILINHIELYPSGYDFFTGRGRMFVSAAEGFFFISGLLVGMTYRSKAHLGMGFIFRKMWRRSAVLYAAAAVTTLGYSYWALKTHHYYIKDDALALGQSWPTMIKRTLLLQYSFGWADFLIHFAVYMFFAPFALYLLIKRQWLLVVLISFLVWSHRGQHFAAAWQVIFFGGIIAGFYWTRMVEFWNGLTAVRRRLIQQAVMAITIVTFGFSYASTYILFILNEQIARLSPDIQHFVFSWNRFNDWVWQWFQKWTMEPGRALLFVIWFAALWIIINRYQKGIDRRTLGIVKVIGQNSLYFYIVHSFVVFIFRYYWPDSKGALLNFLLTSLAILIMIALTLAYTGRQVLAHKLRLPLLDQKFKARVNRFVVGSNR